ncbi:hypothetical protein XELAEV_18012757mg [Xenopus laevis]|uniref:Uncharacterized protein n=1 Tax=Xenopus laevis TaxID=8355 RepID=A0A974HYJ9_XENLA|nr:hypothetical protein XELAEV_18012757mg [Xenopus laevis]
MFIRCLSVRRGDFPCLFLLGQALKPSCPLKFLATLGHLQIQSYLKGQPVPGKMGFPSRLAFKCAKVQTSVSQVEKLLWLTRRQGMSLRELISMWIPTIHCAV